MPIKSSPRILIVESDFIVEESITLTLIKKGFYVDSAHTGTEAVEKAINSPPNILLIEPHLQQDMQGANVTNTILSVSPSTEVIFLSTRKEDEVRKVLIKKPCLFLSKPFDDAQVIEAVENCLGDMKKTNKLFY